MPALCQSLFLCVSKSLTQYYISDTKFDLWTTKKGKKRWGDTIRWKGAITGYINVSNRVSLSRTGLELLEATGSTGREIRVHSVERGEIRVHSELSSATMINEQIVIIRINIRSRITPVVTGSTMGPTINYKGAEKDRIFLKNCKTGAALTLCVICDTLFTVHKEA